MQSRRPFPLKTVLGHTLFWLAYIYYQGIIYSWEDTDQMKFRLTFHVGGLPILITVLFTYFNLYVLLPAFYYRQKYYSYTLSIIAALLAGALLTRLITHLFILPWEQLHDRARYALEAKQFWIPGRIVRVAIQYYPAIAIMTVFELMKKLIAHERQLRAVETEKLTAEMSFLKAQINPHFFFNTMNSLYSLTLTQPQKANKLVLQLSQMMRYLLDKTNTNQTDLSTEIAELENYLQIEQTRFADRLDLSFQCSGDVAGKKIMPLTLLPFAENAFKHGIEGGQSWVSINIKFAGDTLFYNVQNGKPINGQSDGHGIGLSNLRRRLELTYPGKFELNIKDDTDVFEAALKIEL
ncbi:histidine kinase [Mucilaginibacter sp. dw_454]|uniref:sensor histidine kinase n=1 Tax=Mucilaginibacter sp. dw_454 TaxID=2720079 RepID=UPI001BD616F1|nr:histidine kinase [Mucilaginibacter sp. dw_454]